VDLYPRARQEGGLSVICPDWACCGDLDDLDRADPSPSFMILQLVYL
jgi:hypothetical protein